MVTESAPMVKQSRLEPCRANMEPTGRAQSPTAEKVSSAADAMLKLSNSAPNLPVFVVNQESLTGSLPTIGQPPVAYMAQQGVDGASTLTTGLQVEPIEVKPDITQLNLASALSASAARASRKQREFIPDFKKDDHYWMKRRKNNEAAKRSREKRRMNDMALTGTISEVRVENQKLHRELRAIKQKFGLPVDQTFPYDPSEPFQVTSDSSDTSSPGHLVSMAPDMGTNYAVFPTPLTHSSSVVSSPLQTALRQPPRTISPTFSTSSSTSTFTGAAATQLTMAAGTIPFLIPVSSPSPSLSSGQPPLTLMSHVAPAPIPISPAMVTSLNLPPEVMVNPLTANGHQRVDSPQSYWDVPNNAGGSGSPLGPHDTAAFHPKLRAVEVSRPDSGDSNSPRLQIVTNSSGGSASEYSECGDTSDEHDVVRRGAIPLNLCKREKDDGAQGYIEIKPMPLGTSHRHHAIPHKLRHKLAQHIRERGALPDDSVLEATNLPSTLEGETSDGETNGVPRDDHSSSDSASTSMSPRCIGRNNTSIDPKYTERRQRNNQAARKCRENRKVINEMRMAKSTVLETENQRLKEELQNLTSEVSTLKDLIELKNAAKAKGEPFEPPTLKKLQDSSSVSQTEESVSPK